MTVAVILGSAWSDASLPGLELTPRDVSTPHGAVRLHQAGDAWVLFRHRLPHGYLPNQVPYRAHARALAEVGVGALLVTSSVGVLDPAVPLDTLLPVGDLLMPDNRLPDGTACTMWPEPCVEQGHLVVTGGLFAPALREQVEGLAGELGPEVVFAYVGGPRTKTPAENRYWARAGAQVNSMTVGPEVVLANELGIPCAAVVVGHKYSHPDIPAPDGDGVTASLAASRQTLADLVVRFLRQGRAVEFPNQLYRFEEEAP